MTTDSLKSINNCYREKQKVLDGDLVRDHGVALSTKHSRGNIWNRVVSVLVVLGDIYSIS